MLRPTTMSSPWHHRTTITIVALGAIGVGLLPALAGAETLNTCTAGKIKCVNAFGASVFKCVAAAYKRPPTAESQAKGQACVRKARQKFGTAVSPSPGCIDKIEAKQKQSKPETICPLGSDEFGLDDLVKNFTETMQDTIAPVGPSPVGSTCDGGKLACIGATFKGLLACQEKAFKKGVAPDAGCLAKAAAKFSGGANPGKACFAKLEAKQKLTKLKSLCGSDGNQLVVGGQIDAFVEDVVDAITH